MMKKMVKRFDDADLIAELSDNYQLLINKVRTVVKIFRRSPMRNDDVLQKYVVIELGHELNLTLDCKTRWNSHKEMLTRFFVLTKLHLESNDRCQVSSVII